MLAEASDALPRYVFLPQLPWLELLARGVLVYIFLVILIRMTGRRQVGMMAPFDFILLLILSNAVQNSMSGGDNSLAGGLFIATVLIAMNTLMAWLTRRSKFIEGLLIGQPAFIIRAGVLDEKVMAREKITHHELAAALRSAGCPNIEHVRHAILETNGTINIVHRDAA
ncbi:MAG: YetF domain-containing protein [Verrucomicrobiota bacterium]|jgi:uncharacterized membrane protein YcaP (DUF421 family)